MLVSSDRTWTLAVDPATLWSALGDLGAYRRWWPWLRRLDGRSLAAGDVWSATVQPPLPYALRFDVALDEVVEAELVQASVSGDIEGTARLEVSALDGRGSAVRLVSELAPRSRLLRGVAAVAAPVARFGHDWVIDTGVRQFRDRALRA